MIILGHFWPRGVGRKWEVFLKAVAKINSSIKSNRQNILNLTDVICCSEAKRQKIYYFMAPKMKRQIKLIDPWCNLFQAKRPRMLRSDRPICYRCTAAPRSPHMPPRYQFNPWPSADFFSRGGQNFPGGGQKHTICLKNT